MVQNISNQLVSLQQLTISWDILSQQRNYQHCLRQFKQSNPKVGKFWQGTDAEPGIYIAIAGKVRLLDER